MDNRPFTRFLLTVAFAGAVACDGPSKVPPPPPSPALLTATLISPSSGEANLLTEIEVYGRGFQQGATLTWDGVIVSSRTLTSTTIAATAPAHAPGTVSLVVTNPDGQTATLAGAYTYVPPTFAVTEAGPAAGMTGDLIEIAGIGFHARAAVAFDGVTVAARTWVSSGLFRVVAPFHADGPVDVVVTNPDGKSRRLSGGFTYEPVTLTVSSTTVTPAEMLAVSWVVPSGRAWDWIGLYKIEDGSEAYLWYQDIDGATSGALTVPAPAQPGRYEFRYFGSHHRSEHKRSATVTVTAQQSGARQ